MAPKARQAKGKARLAAYDKLQLEAEAAERGPDRLEINIPVGRRLGDTVIEVDHVSKGFGDRLLIEESLVHASPGRASSASSARTVPARRRCSRCSLRRSPSMEER